MEYRFLGKTGLKVSVISFGNWLNSDKEDFAKRTIEFVKKAWDLGINYFDTAELYGSGLGEIQFGAAIKALNVPREDLVISTKIFWGPNRDKNPNDLGLSRKHVIEGTKAGLKRLQQDYVDIIFCHRFDFDTPLEETCRAFDWLIKQGLCHYWGTSEWTAAQIFEAIAICNKYNLVPPCCEQPQYNMLIRGKVEGDFRRLFDLYGYGSTVWSPLAQGLLTGKYNDGLPKDSRIALSEFWYVKSFYDEYFSEANKPKYINTFKGLAEIAKELGATQAQLAMAWVIKNKDVSTAITGCSRAEQIEDSVQAVQVYKKITPEIEARIEALLKTKPQQELDFKTWTPLPDRRK